jgi:hypothetical protein
MSGNLTQINEILFPSRPSPSPRRWVVDVIAKEIDSSRLPYRPPDGSLPLPSELLLFLSSHALLLDHDARTGAHPHANLCRAHLLLPPLHARAAFSLHVLHVVCHVPAQRHPPALPRLQGVHAVTPLTVPLARPAHIALGLQHGPQKSLSAP